MTERCLQQYPLGNFLKKFVTYESWKLMAHLGTHSKVRWGRKREGEKVGIEGRGKREGDERMRDVGVLFLPGWQIGA